MKINQKNYLFKQEQLLCCLPVLYDKFCRRFLRKKNHKYWSYLKCTEIIFVENKSDRSKRPYI